MALPQQESKPPSGKYPLGCYIYFLMFAAVIAVLILVVVNADNITSGLEDFIRNTIIPFLTVVGSNPAIMGGIGIVGLILALYAFDRGKKK